MRSCRCGGGGSGGDVGRCHRYFDGLRDPIAGFLIGAVGWFVAIALLWLRLKFTGLSTNPALPTDAMPSSSLGDKFRTLDMLLSFSEGRLRDPVVSLLAWLMRVFVVTALVSAGYLFAQR